MWLFGAHMSVGDPVLPERVGLMLGNFPCVSCDDVRLLRSVRARGREAFF